MGTHVIYVASEMKPLAQTGGLGDVALALPLALEAEGCKVSVFLPFYSFIKDTGVEIKPTGVTVNVPIGARTVPAAICKAEMAGPDVYLVKIDEYFDRSCTSTAPLNSAVILTTLSGTRPSTQSGYRGRCCP